MHGRGARLLALLHSRFLALLYSLAVAAHSAGPAADRSRCCLTGGVADGWSRRRVEPLHRRRLVPPRRDDIGLIFAAQAAGAAVALILRFPSLLVPGDVVRLARVSVTGRR